MARGYEDPCQPRKAGLRLARHHVVEERSQFPAVEGRSSGSCLADHLVAERIMLGTQENWAKQKAENAAA
jgi:hypothetical protein